MSSVSNSTSQPSALLLNYLGSEEGYALLEQIGDEPPKASGRNLTEAEVNQVLAAHGLRVVSGQIVALDGFQVSSTAGGLSATTEFGGAPPLPDVAGPAASTHQVATAVSNAVQDEAWGDAGLMWMALSTLAHTAMHEMTSARQIRNAMQMAKREAKEGEIRATERNIEKMKDAQWFNFGTAAVTAGTSLCLTVFGTKLGMSATTAQAVSTAVTTALPDLGKAVNKQWGPEAAANDALIAQKEWELRTQIFDEAIEDAKSNHEETKELFKMALKVMSEHVERESQALNSALRT
jgi:hypothetical protein